MRIAVIGAGGVGGYLAHKLIEAGHEVAILARGRHLAAIRESGLVLDPGDGGRAAHPAAAEDDPVALAPADLVIVAVKGQDLPPLLPGLKGAIRESGVALPFLNGVEAPGMLARAFGEQRALIGTARISAFIDGPGRVRQVTEHAVFTFGSLDGRQSVAPVPEIRRVFAEAGIAAPDHPDLRVELWQKFVALAPLAAVTAGARANMATVNATHELTALLATLMEETVAVGRAHGVALPDGLVARSLAFMETLPGEMRASLAHDLDAGKPLELDWLSGAVVRLGEAVGVPTPAHRTVHALLAPYRDGGGPGYT